MGGRRHHSTSRRASHRSAKFHASYAALSSRASQLPVSPEEGVDLAPLMQCLCSERQVFEADVTWDHEHIFQEVSSAINQDLHACEEGEGDNIDHFNSVAPP